MSRTSAATCVDCEWMTRSTCPNGAVDGACAGALLGCPPGEYRLRLMMRTSATAPWLEVGQLCVGGAASIPTVADVAVAVRDRFVDRLARPEPSFQPPGGALVNLPTVFASGQRAGLRTEEFTLLGLPVTVRASPSWRWEFGDGGTLTTTKAGGRYPNDDVAHIYRTAGRYDVTVRASWSGTFTVDGLGPFAVEGGPITQSASVPIQVREAGGQLVGR